MDFWVWLAKEMEIKTEYYPWWWSSLACLPIEEEGE